MDIKKVQRTIDRFLKDFNNESYPTGILAGQICQLAEAECQQRIERIFKDGDNLINTYMFGDGSFINFSDGWRTLKDAEMIDNINKVNDYWKVECQQRIERIKEEIEKLGATTSGLIIIDPGKKGWRDFWKQEGIENNGISV